MKIKGLSFLRTYINPVSSVLWTYHHLSLPSKCSCFQFVLLRLICTVSKIKHETVTKMLECHHIPLQLLHLLFAHSYTHICISVLIGTILDIMPFLAPFLDPNHHDNWMSNPSSHLSPNQSLILIRIITMKQPLVLFRTHTNTCVFIWLWSKMNGPSVWTFAFFFYQILMIYQLEQSFYTAPSY